MNIYIYSYMVIIYYSIVRSRNRMHPSRMKYYARRLHDEELSDLYSVPRMKLAGNVERMGRRGTCIGYW
jgi:hypothetical protein